MMFTTETGSKYEVESSKIRRVEGPNPAQPRQGNDGDWQPFTHLTDVVVGKRVLITWPESKPLFPNSPLCAKPATITSRVVDIAA